MKRKMIIVIAMLLDIILISVLPYRFIDNQISIIPNFFLVALVVTQRQYNTFDNIVTIVLGSFIYSFFLLQPILELTIIYIILFFISKIWGKNILDSTLELTILSVSTIFVKEIIIQGYRYYIYHGNINFVENVVYRIAPTVIFMFFMSLIVIQLWHWYEDYQRVKKEVAQKQEKIYIIDYLEKQ